MHAGRSSADAIVLAVATLIALCGCARDEASSAAVALPSSPVSPPPNLDEPPAPVSPPQAQIVSTDQAATAGQPFPEPQQPVRRLVFQCTDDITFAVRMVGNLLYVYAPSLRGGSLPLTRQPAESGLRYAIAGADFRTDGELATLRLGDEVYFDCVANPAAAVWETEASRNLLQ